MFYQRNLITILAIISDPLIAAEPIAINFDANPGDSLYMWLLWE